jgi:hypothetical protein
MPHGQFSELFSTEYEWHHSSFNELGLHAFEKSVYETAGILKVIGLISDAN